MLSAESQRPIHELIAGEMLSRRRIDASEANTILMHALAGKSVPSLFALGQSVLTAQAKAIELLKEHFFMLPLLRTDQPIFPENRSVSVLLRLAQFKLQAADENADVTACVDALFKEVDEEDIPELKRTTEVLALFSVVITFGIASRIPNWVDLLRRFRTQVEAGPLFQKLKADTERTSPSRTFYGTMFSIGMANMCSVRRLEEIMGALDRLEEAERDIWLEHFDRMPADYSLLVNPAWVEEEKRGELNPAEAAERYERMARQAERWGKRNLAIQCFTAQAVMFDEYLNEEIRAHAAIDEAIAALGEDVAFSRARAKIYWRHDKHTEAVTILHAIADHVGRDSPIDRAFAMREAAISAAKTEDWKQAEAWFGEAQKAAATVQTKEMQAMAIGLEADRAVAAFKIGQGPIHIRGQKARRARTMRVQEFDDDGRFRHRAIARLVAQHRHLGHGPDRAEGGARSLVAQINDNPLESNAVLVQGDERLVAEGRKGMEIELQSHANGLALLPSNVPLR
jgi:hypothetical protein